MTKPAFLFLCLFLLSLNAHGEHAFQKDNMIRGWAGRKDRVQENFEWEVKDIRSKLEDASALTDEELKNFWNAFKSFEQSRRFSNSRQKSFK